jgi:hypothetical protein
MVTNSSFMLIDFVSWQESDTVQESDTQSSHTLHIIHAHLLSYASLLRDFKKSVQFVLETPNPAIDHSSTQKRRFEIECNHLMDEIERLQMERKTHIERLKNVTNLVRTSLFPDTPSLIMISCSAV